MSGSGLSFGDFFRRADPDVVRSAEFRKLKEQALVPESRTVVKRKAVVEHPRVEVVEEPRRRPPVLEDEPRPAVPARHPAELPPVLWAPDDPRHELPRPVFDPAERRSGFAPYVSVRSRARVPHGQRQAQAYTRYLHGRSGSSSDDVGLVDPHSFHPVD